MYVLAFRGHVRACGCFAYPPSTRAPGIALRMCGWVCVYAPTWPGTSLRRYPFLDLRLEKWVGGWVGGIERHTLTYNVNFQEIHTHTQTSSLASLEQSQLNNNFIKLGQILYRVGSFPKIRDDLGKNCYNCDFSVKTSKHLTD